MNAILWNALAWVLRASWQASLLAGIVLLLQHLLGPRLSARGRYALWMIVLLRLLVPILPESRLSIFNLGKLSASTPKQAQMIPPETMVPVNFTVQSPQVGPPAPEVRNRFDARSVLDALAILWAAGGVLLCLRVGWECWKLTCAIGRLTVADDPGLLATLDRSAAELGLRLRPSVRTGAMIRMPAVVGTFRPVLLLPSRVLEVCDANELRFIVLHELAHLKRHDVAGNWLITGATILHWFNPLVWLIADRMRADRELACDELVLVRSGNRDAMTYGRTLLKLVETLSPQVRQPQLVGILEVTSSMKRRVSMIAKFEAKNSGRWFWACAVLLVLGCTTMTDAVRGQARGPSTRAVEQRASHPTGSDGMAGRAAPVELAVETRLPELSFANAKFGEVIDYFRDVGSVNIVVNWKALENAGVDKDATVSLRLRDVTLRDALEHVLTNVGGAVRLAYVIDKGAIIISTDEDLSGQMQTVFYDVRDLLVGDSGSALVGDEYSHKVDQLARVITQTISAESWNIAGGSGTLIEYNGKFVVSQTPRNQKQITLLLARLREQPTTQPRPLSAP